MPDKKRKISKDSGKAIYELRPPQGSYYSEETGRPDVIDMSKAELSLGKFVDTASYGGMQDLKDFYTSYYGTPNDYSPSMPIEARAEYNVLDNKQKEMNPQKYFEIYPPSMESDGTRVNRPIIPEMRYGGNFIENSVKKYQNGGTGFELPPMTSANTIDAETGMSYEEMLIQQMKDDQKLQNVAATTGALTSSASNIISGSSLTKDFYKLLEDYKGEEKFDRKALKKQFKEGRSDKAEGIGEGVGFAAATALTGNPMIGAAVGKVTGFLSGEVSKLFNIGDKGTEAIDKAEGVFLDTQSDKASDAVMAQRKKDLLKSDIDYLKTIGIGKYGGDFNGMVYGPRHESGGVMMYKDGAPIAEVEGDEYVINNDILKDKPESKKKFSIQGTPVQIASALNSINKYGVNTHPGGVVKQVK
jgi:hypothetical protein